MKKKNLNLNGFYVFLNKEKKGHRKYLVYGNAFCAQLYHHGMSN